MDFLVLLHHLLVLTFYAQLKPALDLLMSLQRAQLSDKRLFSISINFLFREYETHALSLFYTPLFGPCYYFGSPEEKLLEN